MENSPNKQLVTVAPIAHPKPPHPDDVEYDKMCAARGRRIVAQALAKQLVPNISDQHAREIADKATAVRMAQMELTDLVQDAVKKLTGLPPPRW